MTDETNEPTSMADEVANRVIAALEPKFDQLRGEIRAVKRDLGEQIDGLGAQQSAMQKQVGGLNDQFVAMNRQLSGMSDQIGALTSVVNGHTAQFRGINERLDNIDTRLDHLERSPVR